MKSCWSCCGGNSCLQAPAKSPQPRTATLTVQLLSAVSSKLPYCFTRNCTKERRELVSNHCNIRAEKIKCTAHMNKISIQSMQQSAQCNRVRNANELAMQQSWPCNRAGHATELAMQQSWQCNRAGNATELAMQRAGNATELAMQHSWQCNTVGNATQLAMQHSWECNTVGNATQLAMQQNWQCTRVGRGRNATGLEMQQS